MKILKSITAAILVYIMALTVIGCHPKDEIAVTIDGHKYTSAYYMCTLINAYMDGQQRVYDTLSDEEISSGAEIDYHSKKIDDKEFDTWVKDRAIEILKEISYYKSLCNDAKLELSEDELANTEYYASTYWSSYGYSTLFEPNGVSEATYTDYMVDGNYSALYFEHLYGEGGEKEIKAKEVESYLSKNFILANLLEVTFSDETDDEKEEIEKQFKNYQKKIKNGKMTFEEAYVEYNDLGDDHSHSDEEDGPKDPHATVIGATGTGYEHDYYSDIEKMDTGEIKLIEKDDDAGYLLVIKQDIEDDDYYLENLDMTIRHLLKDTEYSEEMSEKALELEADISNYAVNQFKVKNIVEPEY